MIHSYSLYEANISVDNISYDVVVFDTYDYMDQVISFSLADTFIAAFKVYAEQTEDERSQKIIELFNYGTNNPRHILLMRYGFPPEIINDLDEHIKEINEQEILLNA